jgi:hypothetical protein
MSVSTLRVPLFSSIADDIGRDSSIIFYLLVIALTVLVLAVSVWGLAALVVTALALVPVIFTLLMWITLP